MNRFVRTALALSACTLLGTSLAHAQATRTWVSGVGDDANPCSRTAPCKTFAGAISKTAAGGEISVLDPGGFGTVTITKSITINGEGTLAGILNAGTTGIIINAGVNDVIVLRNLSINGGSNGINGIRFLAGRHLIVENCTITGFSTTGIDVTVTSAALINVSNTSIKKGGVTGFQLDATPARVDITLDHVEITGTGNAIDIGTGGLATVTNSVISKNTAIGVWANGGAINLEKSTVTGNATGGQAQTGGTLRMADNAFYDNLTGFGCGGGTLASAGNNRKANNVGGGASCSPTITITVQ